MPSGLYQCYFSKLWCRQWARNVGFSAALGLSIGLSACSELAAQAADRSGAKLQLEITVNQHALGESRVQIDSTLTNDSAHSISFLARNTPFSDQLTGRVFKVEERINTPKIDGDKVADNYRLVPYTGIMLKRGTPTAQEFLVLQPGQKIRNSLDITSGYDFAENSQLRVTYDRPINIGGNNFQSLGSNTVDFFF